MHLVLIDVRSEVPGSICRFSEETLGIKWPKSDIYKNFPCTSCFINNWQPSIIKVIKNALALGFRFSYNIYSYFHKMGFAFLLIRAKASGRLSVD